MKNFLFVISLTVSLFLTGSSTVYSQVNTDAKRIAKQYNKQLETIFNDFVQTNDSLMMYNLVVEAVKVGLLCDSFDTKPDQRGTVKPQYRDKNKTVLKVMRKLMVDAGLYLYRHNQKSKALEVFELYLSSVDKPLFALTPYEKDNYIPDAVYYAALIAYQLGDMAFAGSDTWSTSYALSKGVEKINALQKVDVILCGKQTNDSDTGHIGPQLAAWLNWPNAAFVRKVLHVGETSIQVERLTEDGSEVLELPYPCVISVVKDINQPRVRSVKGRLAAKRAEIIKWTADDIGADKTKLGVKNCPTNVVKSFVPTRNVSAVCVEGANAKERGVKLVQMLQEANYL